MQFGCEPHFKNLNQTASTHYDFYLLFLNQKKYQKTLPKICCIPVSLICLGSALAVSNKLRLKNTYKTSEVALALLSILLEQGHQYILNVNEKTKPMLWALVPALLGGVIISNAYKGENINQITAPLSPLKFDTWDAIKRNRFKIYSSEKDFSGTQTIQYYRANHTLLNEIQSYLNGKYFVPRKTLGFIHWLVSMQTPLKKDNIYCFKKSKWKKFIIERIGNTPQNQFVIPDFLKYVFAWHGPLLQELIKCDNVAYFEKREFLELYLLPALKYNGKPTATYSLGQEQINFKSYGTTFSNVRLPGIEERIHLVEATGILTKLYIEHEDYLKKTFYRAVHIFRKEWFIRNSLDAEKELRFAKAAFPKVRSFYRYFMLGKDKLIPTSISIHGNMISLFVLFLGLLMVSTLIFKLEILKSYLRIFMFTAKLQIHVRRKDYETELA